MRFFYNDDPWLCIDDPALAASDAPGDQYPIATSGGSVLGDAERHDPFSPPIGAGSTRFVGQSTGNEQ
jgi:hypothetical protein